MEQRRSVDYIIVGQGLAGSAVALQLLKRGKRLLVIDEHLNNRSSLQAAGLFNPVTGRHMVKTWRADVLFPYLRKFYIEAEKMTGRRFFHPTEIYRPFASIEEQNEWMGRSADASWADFIMRVESVPGTFTGVRDPFGGMILRHAGYLNTGIYMAAVRDLLRHSGSVQNDAFDPEKLIYGKEMVEYGEFRSKRIIFCEGEKSIDNRWFKKIPIRPLKGETLMVKIDWKVDFIVNRGVYVVPGDTEGHYKVGATYSYNDRSRGVTSRGRQEVEGKLQALISVPYTVLAQDWGIRPTTIDRRPLLGHVPGHEELVIFNGLGTKGVSLAPYFSDVLVRRLENGAAIDKEVDVSRYY